MERVQYNNTFLQSNNKTKGYPQHKTRDDSYCFDNSTDDQSSLKMFFYYNYRREGNKEG